MFNITTQWSSFYDADLYGSVTAYYKLYRKGKLDAKIACPFSGRNIKAKLGVLTIQFEDWLFVCFALGWQFKWDAFTMLSMQFAVFFKESRAAVASNAQKTRDHNVGIKSTYCLLALSTCCYLLAANDSHQCSDRVCRALLKDSSHSYSHYFCLGAFYENRCGHHFVSHT